jgi:hypothetical protein
MEVALKSLNDSQVLMVKDKIADTAWFVPGLTVNLHLICGEISDVIF